MEFLIGAHHGYFIQEVSEPSPSLPGPIYGGESFAQLAVGGGGGGERERGLGEVSVAVDILTQ